MTDLVIPFWAAVISNSFVFFLFKPNKLLDFVPFYFQRTIPDKKLNYMLFECETCLSGQISFWWLMFTPDPNFFKTFSMVFIAMIFSCLLGKLLSI